MKLTRSIGLALGITAGGAGLAGAQAFQVPPRQTFEQLDANGDNVIEKGEVPEKARAAFEKMLKLGDTNHDDKLQANEFRDLVQSMRGGAGAGAGAGANLGVFSGDSIAKFKAMDKNGDGKVSREEFPGRPQMFERVDANKDGVLEASEVKALAASVAKAAPAGAAQPGARIMAMDKDGDGKVSKAEFVGAPAFFDRLDSDKDGSLTKDEAAQGPKVMLDLLRAMDTNGDGKISRDEFRGPAERFDQLDADKDGFVALDEIRNIPPTGASPASAKKADAKKGKD
jgi:Ca2+-binding EF-hand superfamily protein